MKRAGRKGRRGASLLIVLVLWFMAALSVTGVFLFFEWSQGATLAARRKFQSRLELAALVRTGRQWLDAEVAARRLPVSGDQPAAHFSDTRRLHQAGGDTVLELFDLQYDPAQARAWIRQEERFLPPRKGAFLIRAVKLAREGPQMTIETVLLVSGDVVLDAPILWREVWL